ncbi:MAG: hypothetical protein GY801_34260 [bacterium]|nr:hypothetical protein [bacterium]
MEMGEYQEISRDEPGVLKWSFSPGNAFNEPGTHARRRMRGRPGLLDASPANTRQSFASTLPIAGIIREPENPYVNSIAPRRPAVDSRDAH